MKHLISLCVFVWAFSGLKAQYTYTIKADSVKLTNCDSSELIIENHTQNVRGFLFNTGYGRTIFKRGVQKLNDSIFLIGADTLNLKNPWLQGGNSFGKTGILGTLDSNNIDLYSNNTQRARLTAKGNLLIGSTTDNGFKFKVNGDFSLDNGLGASIVSNPFPVLTLSSPNLQFNSSSFSLFDTQHTFPYFTASPSQAGLRNPTGPFTFGLVGGSSNLTIQVQGDGSGITTITNGGTGLYPFLGFRSAIQFSSVLPYGGYNYVFTALGGTGQAFAVQDSSKKDKLLVNGPTGNVLINKDTYVWSGYDDGNDFQVGGSASIDDTLTLKYVPLGTSADSVLVWNAHSQAVHKVAQSSLAFNGVLNSSLAVNGLISAQRLTLSAHDWPDYVFDSTYHLPSPDSLRHYIQQNSHLPDAPSAIDVDRKGVDVGDNQKLLLKKIEELTLYMLKQEERIQNLEQQIQQQNKVIDKLKTTR